MFRKNRSPQRPEQRPWPPNPELVDNFTMAAQQGSNISLVKNFIKEYSGYIDIKDSYGYTALMRAARYEDSGFEVLKLLIENGADINIIRDDQSALNSAILESSTKCAKFLVDSGIDLNLKRVDGRNFLMTAANFKNMDMIKMLINRGMNPFEKDDNGHDSFYELRYDDSDIKEFMFKLYEEKNIKIDERLYKLIEDRNISGVRKYFDESFYEGKKTEIAAQYLKLALVNEDVPMLRLLYTRGFKLSQNDMINLKKDNEARYPVYISLLKQAGFRGLSKVLAKTKLPFKIDKKPKFKKIKISNMRPM